MPTKKKTEQVEEVAAPETTVVSNALLENLLNEIKEMKAQIDDSQVEKQRLAEELQAARAGDAAYRPNVAPPGMIDLRADRPASLEEKLNSMAALAEENGEPFDRERTRKILRGEEVPDLTKFICRQCGTGFAEDEEPSYNEHKEAHALEAGRSVGRRG